jgi:hypothetical protein
MTFELADVSDVFVVSKFQKYLSASTGLLLQK